MAKKIEMRKGDTLRIGNRLGTISRDQHGDTVYKHRRGPGTTRHPQAENTTNDPYNPGGFIDRIWSAPILSLVVFVAGIFLCVWLRPMFAALIKAAGI